MTDSDTQDSDLPALRSKREAAQDLVCQYGARNYRCEGGPLAAEMHTGKPGWRMYVALPEVGSRELRVFPIGAWQDLEHVDYSRYPLVLGYYSLAEDGTGDALRWRWTDFGRRWYGEDDNTPLTRMCRYEDGPLTGQTGAGQLGWRIYCVRADPSTDEVTLLPWVDATTGDAFEREVAALLKRAPARHASIVGYYVALAGESGEMVWRWHAQPGH